MNALIGEIRELIRTARQAVVHSVDLIQVLTNFEICRRIVEHEQQGKERAEYGDAVLKALAIALTDEFGRGFSQTNLKMMRRFYLTYQNQIGQTPSGFLPALKKVRHCLTFCGNPRLRLRIYRGMFGRRPRLST